MSINGADSCVSLFLTVISVRFELLYRIVIVALSLGTVVVSCFSCLGAFPAHYYVMPVLTSFKRSAIFKHDMTVVVEFLEWQCFLHRWLIDL